MYSPARATHLSNLGNALLCQFERGSDPLILDAAVAATRRAVDATPLPHPDRCRYLSNLAMIVLTRFERTGDAGDQAEAIALARRAAAGTQPHHPDYAPHLSNLGIALVAQPRSNTVGPKMAAADGPDVTGAIEAWRAGAAAITSSPQFRLRAARMWADAAMLDDRPETATAGYRVAVEVLPQVAWHGLNRGTREAHLARWAGLGPDAAAGALLAGCHDLGLELVEQGRAVLWTQTMGLRGDLGALRERAPELARRMDEVRAALDIAADATTTRATLAARPRSAGTLRPAHTAGREHSLVERFWEPSGASRSAETSGIR